MSGTGNTTSHTGAGHTEAAARTLRGFALSAPLSPQNHPATLSAGLADFEDASHNPPLVGASAFWPGIAHALPSFGAGPLHRRTAAPSQRRALGGWAVGSPVDALYDRILLTPAAVHLGPIAAAQEVPVLLFNGWPHPVAVTSVEAVGGDAQGLSLVPPVLSGSTSSLPHTIAPRHEQSWMLRIPASGPPSIDVRLLLRFDRASAVLLHVTAARVLPFDWPIDWSAAPIERWQWATQILASSRGHEQRRSLRIAPRVRWSVNVLVHQRERVRAAASIAAWGIKTWAMPLWPHMQPLPDDASAGQMRIHCHTAGRGFQAGGLAVLSSIDGTHSQVLPVQRVTDSGLVLSRGLVGHWPAGSRLFPAVAARLASEPQAERITDQLSRLACEFELLAAQPQAAQFAQTHCAAALHRGLPVLLSASDENEPLTHTGRRITHTLDNTTGRALITDMAGHCLHEREHAFFCATPHEIQGLRELLAALRGRTRCLWLPTFADDVQAVQTLRGGILRVASCGLAAMGAADVLGLQDICIWADGLDAPHTARITRVLTVDAHTEELRIEPPLAAPIETGRIRRISFMTLVRAASDEVAIEYLTPHIVRTRLRLQGVAHPEAEATPEPTITTMG